MAHSIDQSLLDVIRKIDFTHLNETHHSSIITALSCFADMESVINIDLFKSIQTQQRKPQHRLIDPQNSIGFKSHRVHTSSNIACKKKNPDR